MAANKGKDLLNKLFDEVLILIGENGLPTVRALKGKMSTQTFYDMLEDEIDGPSRSKRYARATEMRTELLEAETIEIADSKERDYNRDRLRVDTRKWMLAKLHPKKYGDRIDMTSGGKKLESTLNISVTSEAAKKAIENLNAND